MTMNKGGGRFALECEVKLVGSWYFQGFGRKGGHFEFAF